MTKKIVVKEDEIDTDTAKDMVSRRRKLPVHKSL